MPTVPNTLIRTDKPSPLQLKVGESRLAYLRKASRYARRKFNELRELPEYYYAHESFAVRDALLITEARFVDCGTFGVESILGSSDSDTIDYLNTGDTYELTVLYYRERFTVGNWGDIVERGEYE